MSEEVTPPHHPTNAVTPTMLALDLQRPPDPTRDPKITAGEDNNAKAILSIHPSEQKHTRITKTNYHPEEPENHPHGLTDIFAIRQFNKLHAC